MSIVPNSRADAALAAVVASTCLALATTCVRAFNGAVTDPAWRSKPSWYLVSTDDKMIPPDAQRAMSKRAGATVVEVKGSHSVHGSQPHAVAALIAKAAHGVALATR